MIKNPFGHALAAAGYIVGVVLIMNSMKYLDIPDNTILIPIAMLCLFVLSAAVMGFLFVLEPLRLYFENRKQEAVSFFLKTVGYFACFGALFFIALLLTSLK
jgi:hypothetical protein